jgi:DNA-binding transcriptional regulator YiaG
MKPVTYPVEFQIVLPATADSPAIPVEKITVQVYDDCGEQMLTPESSELIERTRARHMGLMHGSDIRALRRQLGLTQDQLSGYLDCGKKSLSRWESGRDYPSGMVNKVLRLLEDGAITIADLQHATGPRLACSEDLTFYQQRSEKIINISQYVTSEKVPQKSGDLSRYVSLAKNS